jgi:hypothetical protein
VVTLDEVLKHLADFREQAAESNTPP